MCISLHNIINLKIGIQAQCARDQQIQKDAGGFLCQNHEKTKMRFLETLRTGKESDTRTAAASREESRASTPV
jgi:hypothetical protein